jgi:hypothetical protein
MPLGGCWLSGARDGENASSGESRNSHNHPVRVGGSSGRDIEAVLVDKSDVHKVAKRVVSLIFGPARPSTESAQTSTTEPSVSVTSQCLGGRQRDARAQLTEPVSAADDASAHAAGSSCAAISTQR